MAPLLKKPKFKSIPDIYMTDKHYILRPSNINASKMEDVSEVRGVTIHISFS